MGTKIFYARTLKQEIAYIRFIFEGYEGVGNIRTLDAVRGLIEFIISSDFIETFNHIIEALKHDISIELIERPGGYESMGDSLRKPEQNG